MSSLTCSILNIKVLFLHIGLFTGNFRSPLAPQMFSLSATPVISQPSQLSDWNFVKRVVGKVHKHLCGHTRFSDMRKLLIHNHLWSENMQHYLTTVFTSYKHRQDDCTSPAICRVSLSAMSREFNQLVAIDHFI